MKLGTTDSRDKVIEMKCVKRNLVKRVVSERHCLISWPKSIIAQICYDWKENDWADSFCVI